MNNPIPGVIYAPTFNQTGLYVEIDGTTTIAGVRYVIFHPTNDRSDKKIMSITVFDERYTELKTDEKTKPSPVIDDVLVTIDSRGFFRHTHAGANPSDRGTIKIKTSTTTIGGKHVGMWIEQ